jgi:hypothetical protein
MRYENPSDESYRQIGDWLPNDESYSPVGD